MKLKPRLLLDALVALACSIIAIYFIVQWFEHGFPLYGRDDMLGGGRKTILPFLWPAIILAGVAFIAVFDFIAYKD